MDGITILTQFSLSLCSSFSDGDTAALRESLAQLSNASSPAESVISTTSSHGYSGAQSHGGGRSAGSSRREKGRNRGGKKKGGSKNGSRGSTPPLGMME